MKGHLHLQPIAKKALTIVELTVVLGIVALLMGLGLHGWQSVKTASQRTQALAEMAEIAVALEEILVKEGVYPTTLPLDTKDPWGSSYNYLLLGEGYTLKSFGPDEKVSDDDILYQK